MKKFWFLGLLLLLPVLASAQDCTANLSWTAPTAYTDGRALNASTDLSGYNIYTTLNGTTTKTTAAASATTATVPMTFGDVDTFTITAVDKATGTESAMSNSVMKTCISNQPKPPTLLQVVLAWLKNFFHNLGWA